MCSTSRNLISDSPSADLLESLAHEHVGNVYRFADFSIEISKTMFYILSGDNVAFTGKIEDWGFRWEVTRGNTYFLILSNEVSVIRLICRRPYSSRRPKEPRR